MPINNRSAKFVPSVKKSIIDAIEEGNFIETSCLLAGIHPTTFYKWEERSRSGELPYVHFFEEVERARAVAEAKMVRIVKDEADRNWRAAIWWLERSARERWGSLIDSDSRPITNPQRVVIEILDQGT
ncbi:hypothetical protein DSECCO2_474780 [anaerobic digester metagenome]